jgi:hypothetical protein
MTTKEEAVWPTITKHYLCKQWPLLGKGRSSATEEVYCVEYDLILYHGGQWGKQISLEWLFL